MLIWKGLALDVNAFGDDAVLGCDFAGKVVDVHSTVTKLKPGDKIAGFVWGGMSKKPAELRRLENSPAL
jgi:NADPH:quinone reductase-like Zn-dependent oxidoreductase